MNDENAKPTIWSPSQEPDQTKPAESSSSPALDRRAIGRTFERFAKSIDKVVASTRGNTSLEDFENALRQLPDDIGEQIIAARDGALSQLSDERTTRAGSMGRALTDFLNGCRRDGISVRETEGWRIGRVQFDIRRETGQARVTYNREPVIDWTEIADSAELRKLYERADAMLDSHSIPDEALADSLWDAYRHLAASESQQEGAIRIKDLHRELRAQLFRREIGSRPDREVKGTPLPTWAFLFNLDRYRDRGAEIPPSRRLTFETGSQKETERLGVALNGLRAEDEYKSYCFVRRASVAT